MVRQQWVPLDEAMGRLCDEADKTTYDLRLYRSFAEGIII